MRLFRYFNNFIVYLSVFTYINLLYCIIVVFYLGRILTDVPCKVCQDHSSGKHYGIYACDGYV